MSRKRKGIVFDDYEKERKSWNKLGPEQALLEEFINTGKLSATDGCDELKILDPVFGNFSRSVLQAHLRETRKKLNNTKQEPTIEELIGIPSTAGRNRTVQPQPSDNCDSIQFGNAPVKVWSAPDYKAKCTKVFVAITLFSGVKDIDFKFSDDGSRLIFSYTWPNTACNPNKLFEGLTSKPNEMSIDLKQYTFAAELMAEGITEKSTPKGEIIVNLPIPVQKDDGSWSKTKVQKDDGTRIYLAEFRGFQDRNIVEQCDTSLGFD